MPVAAVLIVIGLASGAPADALELGPADPPPSVEQPAPAAVHRPPSTPSGGTATPLADLMRSVTTLLAALGGSLGSIRPGRGRGPMWAAVPTYDDPLIVFVTGHGNDPGDFDALRAQMGVDAADAVVFDWRAARLDADHATASKVASIDEAAGDLHSLLSGLSHLERPIYLIGFSKGGAAIAELVAWWDQDPSLRLDAVYGAALLDPPIAGGPIGLLQGAGRLIPAIPDNGGFHRHRCDDGECRDVLDGLGRESGIEVVVIQNPDAMITNLVDPPDSLRVYELHDDGGSPAARELIPAPWEPSLAATVPALPLLAGLWRSGRRAAEAHSSVLEAPQVAACVEAEARSPGSCDDSWDG